jgi:hypothetical protein
MAMSWSLANLVKTWTLAGRHERPEREWDASRSSDSAQDQNTRGERVLRLNMSLRDASYEGEDENACEL